MRALSNCLQCPILYHLSIIGIQLMDLATDNGVPKLRLGQGDYIVKSLLVVIQVLTITLSDGGKGQQGIPN